MYVSPYMSCMFLLQDLKVNQSETVSVCVHWNIQVYPVQNYGMPSADNIASHESREVGLISDTKKVIKIETTYPDLHFTANNSLITHLSPVRQIL